MDVTALNPPVPVSLRGPAPLLRLQSDERLIALVRRGNHAAFEALVGRYQARLLAFCRHMLGSREDAEDVLQEVFAASFNAIIADDRPINVRPWLYRIARNRSLNHLRRVQPIGVDSMDIHLSEGGTTTADKVHKREDFRLLVSDVQELPETQKTALLLREIDALSYEQIAEAMETTIPSVKSLLVRARVSLAEAAEARLLTCDEVREELGEVAEGLKRSSAPVRRHVRGCERCQGFKAQLRVTNKALAAVFPVAPMLLFKKALLAQFGMTASAGAGSAAGAATMTAAAGGATSAMSAGISTVATKACAGLAAAAIVTAGAVEVKHVQTKTPVRAIAAATPKPVAVRAPAAPAVVAATQQPSSPPKIVKDKVAAPATASATKNASEPDPATTSATTISANTDPTVAAPPATVPTLAPTQTESESTTLTGAAGPPAQTGGVAAPVESAAAAPAATPAAAAPTTPHVPATPQAPVTPAPVAPAPEPEPDPDTAPAAQGTGGAIVKVRKAQRHGRARGSR